MPCYFSKRVIVAAKAIVASSLLIGVVGGCADALTYAKDSRREGMGLYNEGNYVDASASFANATRQDPRDYKSYYYAGASYEALHSYQQAISCYKSCLDVMPLTLDGKNDNSFRIRTIDSLATAISKSSTQAVETVELEKKCNGKGLVEDQWLLAKIYRYTGDADAAIDSYNKAVLLAPGNFVIAKEAGLYEEGLGQTDRATFALKKANLAHPDDQQVTDALRRMGVATGPTPTIDRDLAQAPLQ